MVTDKQQLANLMNLTSGDKKHDPSAYSTMGVLAVLYTIVFSTTTRPIHKVKTVIDSS